MSNFTFPHSSRLHKSVEYDKVFKNPVRATASGISVLAVKSENIGNARLGLVVPKKVLKRAVWRNRVKRIIRESFRLSQHSFPEMDVVVIAKHPIKDLSNADLSANLNKLWAQISRRLQK